MGSIRWREDADSQEEGGPGGGGSAEEGPTGMEGLDDQEVFGEDGHSHPSGAASDDGMEEEHQHRIPRRPVTRSRSRLSAVPLVSEAGELS